MRNISDSIYTAESSSSVLGTRQAHFIRRRLRRTVRLAGSIVLCLCSLLSRAPLRAQGTLPQGPEYRYGVRVEMVNLFATVQNAAGKLVTNLRRDDFYKKELSFQVSCSYGPGRYDVSHEQGGVDYPLPYVRWTEARNRCGWSSP